MNVCTVWQHSGVVEILQEPPQPHIASSKQIYVPANLQSLSNTEKDAPNNASITVRAVDQRQQERQGRLLRVCKERRGKMWALVHWYNILPHLNIFQLMHQWQYYYYRTTNSQWHYKLNKKHKYLFCPIPKSGWSSWKRLWHYTSGLISSYATDVGTGSDVKAGVIDIRGTAAIRRAYETDQYNYSFVFVRCVSFPNIIVP